MTAGAISCAWKARVARLVARMHMSQMASRQAVFVVLCGLTLAHAAAALGETLASTSVLLAGSLFEALLLRAAATGIVWIASLGILVATVRLADAPSPRASSVAALLGAVVASVVVTGLTPLASVAEARATRELVDQSIASGWDHPPLFGSSIGEHLAQYQYARAIIDGCGRVLGVLAHIGVLVWAWRRIAARSGAA